MSSSINYKLGLKYSLIFFAIVILFSSSTFPILPFTFWKKKKSCVGLGPGIQFSYQASDLTTNSKYLADNNCYDYSGNLLSSACYITYPNASAVGTYNVFQPSYSTCSGSNYCTTGGYWCTSYTSGIQACANTAGCGVALGGAKSCSKGSDWCGGPYDCTRKYNCT
jgi:hypothetical protein